MAKYVVKYEDGSYSDTAGWHRPVADLDDAKVFQTKSAASGRANAGTTLRAGEDYGIFSRMTGKVVRVRLTEVEE